MEATRGNGYAPAWGLLVMMMVLVFEQIKEKLKAKSLITKP